MTTNFFNTEAEIRLLGMLAHECTNYNDVSDMITERDFHNADHRTIFSVIRELSEQGKDFDIVELSDVLEKKYKRGDWLVKLGTLAKAYTGNAKIKSYAQLIKDYSTMRILFLCGHKITEIAKDDSIELPDKITQAQNVLLSLDQHSLADKSKPIKEYGLPFLNEFEEIYKSDSVIPGITTGFDCFDKRLKGYRPGQLITIAARPAMGKTNLGMNLAKHVGLSVSKSVLYFSIEMTGNELYGRWISDTSDIDYDIIQTAAIDETKNQPDRWTVFSNGVGKLNDSKIILNDSGSITLGQIVSEARKIHRKFDLVLIVVDHIGLIKSDGETETIRMGRISRALKELAKELKITVIALCQLNRQCENRSDKRPMLSDLRNSGDIEQDSDIVGFIYRDCVYEIDSPMGTMAEIIWRKVRGGQIGTDYLDAEFNRCRFAERPYSPPLLEKKYSKRGVRDD